MSGQILPTTFPKFIVRVNIGGLQMCQALRQTLVISLTIQQPHVADSSTVLTLQRKKLGCREVMPPAWVTRLDAAELGPVPWSIRTRECSP